MNQMIDLIVQFVLWVIFLLAHSFIVFLILILHFVILFLHIFLIRYRLIDHAADEGALYLFWFLIFVIIFTETGDVVLTLLDCWRISFLFLNFLKLLIFHFKIKINLTLLIKCNLIQFSIYGWLQILIRSKNIILN